MIKLKYGYYNIYIDTKSYYIINVGKCKICNNKINHLYFSGYVERPDKFILFENGYIKLDSNNCYCNKTECDTLLCTIFDFDNLNISSDKLKEYDYHFLNFYLSNKYSKKFMKYIFTKKIK
jgi:hypothetical protein